MTQNQLVVRTALALLAFAGNSLLCRLALRSTTLDPASFTSIRLLSAAVTLSALVYLQRKERPTKGDWPSGLALFAYAAAFSLAYVNLTAGTGALLLFGAVQITMISAGYVRGERLSSFQILGLAMACAGLIWLVLPGLSAPPLQSSVLMVLAGVAWGIYSLRGGGATDPLNVTAGNFLRTVPMTAALSAVMLSSLSFNSSGALLAIASGAVTSGLGYAIWYGVLPRLKAANAATLQLSVPVIAAVAAILLLGEQPNLRLAMASVTIIFGIWLVINFKAAVAAK